MGINMNEMNGTYGYGSCGAGGGKKVGVRVESRYHEIGEDTSEALCYFAALADLAAEDADDSANDRPDVSDADRFTSDNAAVLTNYLRQVFEPDDERVEIYTEGELFSAGGRLEVRYREPKEATGMGNSVTSISFDEKNRGIITITRGGDVYAALVLERGVRHTCAYNTGPVPLLIYTTAKRIDNKLTSSGGTLDMIYTIESQFGTAQFNRVTVTVTVERG